MNNNYPNLPVISRQNGFTGLRILCSLIVVYEHFVILIEPSFFCLGIRDIAVDVFFVLSGFWVTRSFFTSKNLQEFFKKRIKKIFQIL